MENTSNITNTFSSVYVTKSASKILVCMCGETFLILTEKRKIGNGNALLRNDTKELPPK